MDQTVWIEIVNYFENNSGPYFASVREHITISLLSLIIACAIGIPCGYACQRNSKSEKLTVSFFQVLRIIPSLAVLVLLLPILGTGSKPAICALVLLAVPPILMNTVSGLHDVPDFMLETALGMGMTDRQALWKVRIPLAMPSILTGIKTAMIEIIASATLASKIGAGGLGDIIFTGLGLFRTDLLLIGGISVAILSIVSGALLDLLDRILLRYQYTEKQR